MRDSFIRLAGSAAAIALAAGISTAAAAQTQVPPAAGAIEEATDGAGFEDIVVTARRRAESLQNVPVAVVAIQSEQLQNNLATDLGKLAELAPQVVIGRALSGNGAVISIRGISTSPNDTGLDQSVSLNIDGAIMSRGRIIGATLFDVAQVEVLQGPQALFFGKNSPAGVISITTADPTDRFEGMLRAGYEFVADERYVEGFVSSPLTDTLKARIAFRAAGMDGWIRNVAAPIANPFQPATPLPGAAGPRQPKSSGGAVRGTLLWTPTSDFEAKLKLTYDSYNMNGNSAFGELFCTDENATPVYQGVVAPNADCRKDRVKAESTLPAEFAVNYPYARDGVPYHESRYFLATLGLSKTFGDLSLTSTTSYYRQTNTGSATGDYGPFAQIFATDHERYRMISQELRLNSDFDGPLNFTLGAYFENARRNWFNAPNLFNVYNPVAQNYATNIQTSRSDNYSYSAFGQIRWKIVPSLELSAGARFTHDTKSSRFVNEVNNLASATGQGLYPEGVPLNASYSASDLSPEVTLTWRPNNDNTVYAGYKTGYKAGGLSNASLLSANATAASVTFGPESVEGFEVGYKAQLFNRSVRLDLVAYRYNYNGLQVTSFDAELIRYRINNAARARTTGVTATVDWLASDSLRFKGSLGYNVAKYTDFRNAQCYSGQNAATGCVGGMQNLSGRQLNRAPEFTATLGGEYTAQLGNDWAARFSLDGSYSSSYITSIDYAPGGFQPSFWRLNAAVHLVKDEDRFDLAVIGRNLTNTYYLAYAFTQAGAGAPNQFFGVFNRPREVAVQATVRF